jgi:hypothetical protein
MLYSEKLAWVIFYLDKKSYRVAYNVDAEFINAAYNEKKAAISIVVGNTDETLLINKLDSWVSCVGQSELNCEEFDYNELCNELQKMRYWQNSVEIMAFVDSEPRFENVTIEEETETEQGVLSFTLDGKDHHFLYEGTHVKGGKINGGFVRIAQKAKMIDVLKNIVL